MYSENRNMYSTFKDLTHCKLLESNKLICENNKPIFLSNSRQICEIMPLTNPKEIPKNCDVRITNSINEIWHKLSNNSSWIYITPKEIDVTLSCTNYPLTSFLLNNVGIITLKENCKLYTSFIIISSDPTVQSSNFQSVIPDIDLVNDCCENKILKNLSVPNFVPIRPVNLDRDSLNIASHKLDQLKDVADELYVPLYSTLTNNSYFVYVICTIFKCILLYLVYRLYRYVSAKCNKRHEHDKSPSCQQITNCLMLNICSKRKNFNSDITLEGEPGPSVDDELSSSNNLRRSIRIAKLKDKM
ncbi:hypothetical protein NQ314_012706 [Rhamnusium bicolor]|uniref:Envelope protein n=1 Tax=Rhamnusium bicolor TaxID=1586634 RepID=A0AAV8XAJ2_9CUCU|nr:hypothetical protein NQ314_012706 [Rhamnusium bicolor]